MEIKFKHFASIALISILLISCKTGKEALMPFKNHQYTASRIFPVKSNDSDYSIRVWMSSSTSIDRIISVSKDEDWGEQSNLIEIGTLSVGKNSKDHYKLRNLSPKSGVDGFLSKARKLDLMSFSDQEDPLPIALHQPISLYVVEIKDGDKFNSFRFNTYFPDTTSTNTKFDEIEDLILSEFDITFYR